MKSALTRFTMVRTPGGLVPVSNIKPGDHVIGVIDGQVSVDNVISIDPRTVDPKVYEIGIGKDSILIGGDQVIGDVMVKDAPIGLRVNYLTEDSTIGTGALQMKHTKKYDDIIFSMKTSGQGVFIGDKGIFVETN